MTIAMVPSEASRTTPAAGDTSFHAVQRRLAALMPAEGWATSAPVLEMASLGVQDAPRLISAKVVEGRVLRAHAVEGAPEVRFQGFLDGTQASRPIGHPDGVPVVHGVTAAVVRQRIDRRMRTWDAPLVERRVYAPLKLLPDAWRAALANADLPIVDTLEARTPDSLHPFALQDAAVHAVQEDREALERQLAEQWCRDSGDDLLVDGSIAGSEPVATSARAVGVIKSHRTLYAEGDALRTVLRLGAGERSSVFRITSPRRTPVASWYLRLRGNAGRDPLWGLVRVEVADVDGSREVAGRANEVSRWVLAEALPLAIPDGRWDKMVYGIRDCEEFLRAIQ